MRVELMTWTITNLLIQFVAGILGGHAAAAAAKEHEFGALGHTLVGAVGGALSGVFLQTLAATVVTASGDANEPTLVELYVLQGLTGAIAGGILTLVAGFIKHSMEAHKSQNR
jgi:uncharacterized membrane protein YeaQ/YmgE (transglycosylase-associated protein family)